MKSYVKPIAGWIVLAFVAAGMNSMRLVAETAGGAADQPVAAEDVEGIQLETLPRTNGGWTFAPKGQWEPLTEEDAMSFLDGKIPGNDARNTGNGWVSGLGFKLRKPTALRRIVIQAGGPKWLDLESIVVYCSDAEGEKALDGKDWVEMKVVEPDEWPDDGKVHISIDDAKPHRWWGFCFIPAKGQASGNISIGGIRLFQK